MQNEGDIGRFSVDEVGQFFQKIGLGHKSGVLKQHAIDGLCLLQALDDHLKNIRHVQSSST